MRKAVAPTCGAPSALLRCLSKSAAAAEKESVMPRATAIAPLRAMSSFWRLDGGCCYTGDEHAPRRPLLPSMRKYAAREERAALKWLCVRAIRSAGARDGMLYAREDERCARAATPWRCRCHETIIYAARASTPALSFAARARAIHARNNTITPHITPLRHVYGSIMMMMLRQRSAPAADDAIGARAPCLP